MMKFRYLPLLMAASFGAAHATEQVIVCEPDSKACKSVTITSTFSCERMSNSTHFCDIYVSGGYEYTYEWNTSGAVWADSWGKVAESGMAINCVSSSTTTSGTVSVTAYLGDQVVGSGHRSLTCSP